MIYYLGLDLGTTAVKAVVFRADGVPAGEGLAEYTLLTPRPDIVELAADEYLRSAAKAVEQAVKNAGINKQQIRSMAITGQVETLVFVDKQGNSVRNAIVWLDNRADVEAAELKAKFGAQELFALSGQTEMLPCWPAAKILWLKRHEPENFRKTAKFLMVEDYVAWKLSGEYRSCRGLLPSTSYYDIRTGEYHRGMLDYLELTADNLPDLCEPGEIVGRCKPDNYIGLPSGMVIGGAPLDHVCGALGAGCTGPGCVSETTGCTMALCAPTGNQPVYDNQLRISTYGGFNPHSFVLLPWAPTAGMLLRYLRDEFGGNLTYNDLTAEAASIAPGSDGLIMLPHCAGAVSPVCNPKARGVIYGVTLAHKRPHYVRAVMESVAYLLKDNVETLQKLGVTVNELRVLGGASKSPLWLQIKADVLNLPLALPRCSEATSLGAAILGAVAAGDFAGAAEGAAAMTAVASRLEPGENRNAYEKAFAEYRKLNELLLPTFR